MPEKHLKTAFLTALILALGFLSCWEMYWRTQTDRYNAALDDDRYFWAEQRALLEDATAEDVVLIGSSRTAFNFNTHIWEKTQGKRPINLSTDGKPAGPFLEDIVEMTGFRGTIIMGVTPVLFFSDPHGGFWQDAKQWPDHYHKQTYAQKLGHQLSKPLQRRLVMLTATELDFHNDLDLKSLLNTIPLKNRIPNNFVLPKFSYSDEQRNLLMYPAMKTDTAFASMVQRAWMTFLPNIPAYEVVAETTPPIIDHYVGLIEKFKQRGGTIIMVRHKAEPEWYKHAQRMMPREQVWDKLVAQANIPTYHFEDYPFMQAHTLPDWSHMAADDAEVYTKNMVNQLIQDGHLKRY